MTFSPKSKFQSDKKRAQFHAELVRTEDFQAAVEASLAQYASNLRAEEAFKIKGAVEFIDVLINLGDIVPKSTLPTGHLEPQ